MTATQFLVLVAVIHLTHANDKRVNVFMGLAFIFLASLVGLGIL